MRFVRWVLLLAITFSLFPVVAKADEISVCPSGSILGHPPTAQVPTYDYDASGTLQFHFHLTSGSWNYNTLKLGFYDDGCVFNSEQSRGQVGGVYLPDVKNLLVKVELFQPGKFNLKVYNEDTGEFQGSGLGFVPNDFNYWGLSLTLSNVTGSYFQPVVDTVTTPVASLQRPVMAPTRNPILIIPGIMGTELYEGSQLLWPNVDRMLTDVGDDFLDDLSLSNDFSSIKNITAGNLVMEPFLGGHYYDNLVAALKSDGYTENQDLFVYPYDWRYGISDKEVNDLAARIKAVAGTHKIDGIAHSMGGLLLKKAMQNLDGKYLDKVIMIAVPHMGAYKALAILKDGDDLGIPWLSKDEIKKIAQNFPGVYDLIPSEALATAPTFSVNTTAWNDASQLHTSNFDNFEVRSSVGQFYNIIGCGAQTLGKDGIVSGDGTVSVTSASQGSNSSSTYYILDSTHAKLPSSPGSLEVIEGILQNAAPTTFTIPNVTQDVTQCNLAPSTLVTPIINSAGGDLPPSAPGGGSTTGSPTAPSLLSPGTPDFLHDIPPAPIKAKAIVETVLPHAEHSLVQYGQAIYLIEQGQRRGFKSLSDYLSYGFSPNSLIQANLADLDMPEGILMPAKPGILAKDSVTKKFYYLNYQLQKQLVSTRQAKKRLLRNFPHVYSLDLSKYFLGNPITK